MACPLETPAFTREVRPFVVLRPAGFLDIRGQQTSAQAATTVPRQRIRSAPGA